MNIHLYGVKEYLKTTKGKIVAGVTALTIGAGTLGCISFINKSNDEEINSSPNIQLETPTKKLTDSLVDVNTETYGIYLKKADDVINDANFVLIDFNIRYSDNGNVVSKSNYKELTEIALNSKVQVGYLFNPSSTDRASMYLAVKEIKEMLTYNDINYPIIYNVDSLSNSENEQDKEYNYSILKSFIEKMTENKCYVMIAGSIETLNDMEQRFESHENNNIDFKSLDKLVFDDVDLKDDYCMKIVDNKIISLYNFTSFINLNGINDKGHFVNDCVHTVKPGDTLDTIADIYDFNTYNIIKYNNIYEDLYETHKLYNGQQIYIPSQITKENEIISIRDYNYNEQEQESNLVSISGVYVKDKQTDLCLSKTSFALIEFEAEFNENGFKEYITGNYAFQKYTDAKIPFGIVYNPSGVKLSDVYCSIKALKIYMQTYDVKYPIYYNVDTIFESSNEDKYNYDLSKAFIEKMEYNGCFVGYIGTQENINKLRMLYEQNGDLEFFDSVNIALKLDNNELVTYDKNVGLYVNGDKEVISKVDYEGIITNSNLNTNANFKDDFAYTVQKGDTLDSISDKYNFAKWNIAMYNPQYDLSKGIVQEGQVIYIPNILIHNKDFHIDIPQINIDSNGKYYIGIDVSANQGKIDWEQVKPYIDYAILKFGNGWFFKGFGGYTTLENSIDSTFKYNYSECKRLGIPVGVYVFSNYYMEGNTNEDYLDEAKREAEYAAKYLHDNGYTFELPFYMDYEPNTSGSMYENVTVDIMKDIINIQKDVIESYGYYYAYYTGANFYDNYIKLTGKYCESWIARYPSSETINTDGLKYCIPSYSLEGSLVNNNQISEAGTLPGISIGVDINLADQELFDNCNEFYKKQRP